MANDWSEFDFKAHAEKVHREVKSLGGKVPVAGDPDYPNHLKDGEEIVIDGETYRRVRMYDQKFDVSLRLGLWGARKPGVESIIWDVASVMDELVSTLDDPTMPDWEAFAKEYQLKIVPVTDSESEVLDDYLEVVDPGPS